MKKPQFYSCHSILEKDGIFYEITSVNAPFQSYEHFYIEGARNALGKVTNEGAICTTQGKTGYIKRVNSDDPAFPAAFGNYRLVSEPDYSQLF